MSNPERQLLLLFTRLTWPSVLVRERAIVAIAKLLRDPQQGDQVRRYYLSWLRSQRLESSAACGLLILLQAKMQDPGALILPVEELIDHLSKPSILSWMLLNELFPSENTVLEESLSHSGNAPREFKPDLFFGKYIKSFLPAIYDFWAECIEEREQIPFRQQWAYEWAHILKDIGMNPTHKPLDFWVGHRPSQARYFGADMVLSDVYLSAYLRALSWAMAQGFLTAKDAQFLAAQACPIDLEMWLLKPEQRPTWWPSPKIHEHTIDTTSAEIWKQVEELWAKQQIAGDTWIGNDWMLTEAGGLIETDTVIYELEIFGVLQRCQGTINPDLATLIDWCSGERHGSTVRLKIKCPSPLRFRGISNPESIDDWLVQIDDWDVIPLAGYASINGTVPRWQFWRIRRHCWLPAAYLSNEPVEFRYDYNNALCAYSQGEIIGKWNDWIGRLSEKGFDPIPPATGQYLLVSSRFISKYREVTKANFCWICRLTGYYREHPYENYKQFTTYRIFGASSVIRV